MFFKASFILSCNIVISLQWFWALRVQLLYAVKDTSLWAIDYKSKAHLMIQTKSSYRTANISSKYKITVENTGSVIVAM